MLRIISRPFIAYRHLECCCRLYSSDKKLFTHYEVLGLPATATKQEIRSAFLQLTKQYHPDTRKGDKVSDNDKFHEIRQAYDVLSDEKKKVEYDYNLLRQTRNIPPFEDFLSPYYRDGTIYTEPKDDKSPPRINIFTNGQIVILILLFALVGGIVQLSLVKLYAKKRFDKEETVNQEGQSALENLRTQALRGRTRLQMQIVQYQLAQEKDKERVKVADGDKESLIDKASISK